MGSARALVVSLREALPDSPWSTIPVDMFRWGGGGGLSWGTICGALNGVLPIINLVTMKDYGRIGNELIGWYTTQPFPNPALDIYTPNFKNQVQTVSPTPLCHTSVSTWCTASGKTVNSAEKKARCAKLAGEVAAKAVELLDALFEGSFVPAFKFDPNTQNCMDCHTAPTGQLDNEQGKMNCESCHDPHL